MVRNFKIILNKPPQTTFSPGSEVSGTLTFEVNRPKSYHHVTVALLGRAHVHWTDFERDRTAHTANEDILSLKVVVWDKEQGTGGGKLQTGKYSFPFQFSIPKEDLPSSFGTLDSIGWIRYYVEGRIGTGQMKFDHVVQAVFPFTGLVDINSPNLRRPVRQEIRKTTCCCCCISNKITLSAETPRTGYCIGEVIPLNITAENGSSQQIKISAILTQKISYHARGTRCGNRFLVIGASSNPIQGRSSISWSPGHELKVPQTALSLASSGIINVQYVLMVTAVIPRSRNSSAMIPITIGNVPLQNQSQTTATTPAPPTRAPLPSDVLLQGRSTPDFPPQDPLPPRVLFSPPHARPTQQRPNPQWGPDSQKKSNPQRGPNLDQAPSYRKGIETSL